MKQDTMLELNPSFTVYGNHKDKNGNPLPCPRLTHQGRFSKKAVEYNLWRDHVRTAFFDAIEYLQQDIPRLKIMKDIFLRLSLNEPPISEYKTAHIKLNISFVNKKSGKYPHPDPDNVLKGVLDALFVNDNRVSFEVYFTEYNARGSIAVKMEITF